MLEKKISLKEWTYIGRYNHAAKWCRRLCTYTLIREGERTFKREQKVNLFAYILIFIPIHLLQAFVCMWDGGLKEFIIFSRDLGHDTLQKGSECFKRAEEVWAGTFDKNKNIKNLF
jgi:hypothetical protein